MPKPTFNGRPSIRYLSEFKLLILETTFSPSNITDVKWLFDNRKLIENEKYKLRAQNGNAMLKIKNPNLDDSGNYVVIIGGKHGNVKQNIQVNIRSERSKDAPVFIDEPSENWIDEETGKKLILKLNIRSATKPSFKWAKDDQELEMDHRIQVKTKEDSAGVYSVCLQIKDLDIADLGEYICTGRNDFGQLQAIFKLHGEIPKNAPEFPQKPLIVEKEIDGKHTTVFDVAFRTNDEPLVTWYDPKNNLLSNNNRMKLYLRKDELQNNLYTAIFQLRDYKSTDNGIFTCRIQNKTTKEMAVAEIFLNIFD